METSLKGRRVLVTGGAGFIGTNLVRRLVACDADVTVLDSLVVGRRENVVGFGATLIEGDIMDGALVTDVVASQDAVVHFAAQTGVPGSLAAPRHDCEVNVLGTLTVLEAVRAAQTACGPRFVFASSNAPLGRQVPPASEDKAPLPISPYGASKLAGEAYCLAYHGAWQIATVALRFGNVYGPHCGDKQSVVAKFMRDFQSSGAISIDGDGQQTRDFIYVEDLCGAVLKALETPAVGEVFQIATGQQTSIAELAEMVRGVVGGDLRVSHAAPRAADIKRSYSDIRKARDMLGWEPTVDLRDGLSKTWAWFRTAV
jgi:UDP-glucose 4-epimerase